MSTAATYRQWNNTLEERNGSKEYAEKRSGYLYPEDSSSSEFHPLRTMDTLGFWVLERIVPLKSEYRLILC